MFEEITVNINKLLDDWMYNNFVDLNNTKSLNSYTLTNIPQFIPLLINRFKNTNERIMTNVNIQSSINPFQNSTSLKWNIHSIICHSGETAKSGHYYSIIFDDILNKWYIFDDQQVESFKELNIKSPEISNDIKKNVVMIFYKLQ